jgi:DNA repair protein RadD
VRTRCTDDVTEFLKHPRRHRRRPHRDAVQRRGSAQIFTNVVNVATTDQLIAEGFLVPVKAYAGKAADMTGAKTKFDGEWAEDEMEKRGITIVGDIVSEWIAKTLQHFDGPVKTIAFSATVAHGEELCKRFQDAGFNFQQVSYKDGNDDKRRALIEEFRKPDSEIMGLVSCEALAKGFDVPDIKCGISARPYRKSLSGHIQQLGRVMRRIPGKTFALWLDHSGNFLRFIEDTQEVFAQGVARLERSANTTRKVRKEPDEKEKAAFTCGACKFLMGMASHCPACGWERPKTQKRRARSWRRTARGQHRRQGVEAAVVGADRDAVWRQLCSTRSSARRATSRRREIRARAVQEHLPADGRSPSSRSKNVEPPTRASSRRSRATDRLGEAEGGVNFLDFAAEHGLIIEHLSRVAGSRVKTTDNPKKRTAPTSSWATSASCRTTRRWTRWRCGIRRARRLHRQGGDAGAHGDRRGGREARGIPRRARRPRTW